MKDKSNPFNSPLVGIFLQNIDATTSLDILSRNDECEYHRLELTESIFDSFPSGILIVRDKADFISQLDKYLIIYIKFVYENGGSDTFRIHSVAHLNNAASATEETYIAVNFSNAFYFFCQENTLSTILNIKKSKVYRIDKFFEEVGKKAGSSNIRSVVINNRTDNYICYRPLNPKLDGTEVTSDNIPEYLNYLTTYSVPLKSALPAPTGKTTSRYTDKPRYVFWSSWGNDLNLKFISSVTDDRIGQTALKDYNLMKRLESKPELDTTITDLLNKYSYKVEDYGDEVFFYIDKSKVYNSNLSSDEKRARLDALDKLELRVLSNVHKLHQRMVELDA
jgi:hypothetical protein